MPTPAQAPDHTFRRGRLRTTSTDPLLQLLEAAGHNDVDANSLRAMNDHFEQHHGAALASLPGLGAN